MALTDNVVAAWEFNESSGNAADATGGGKTLTANNSPTFVSGLAGNCADLEQSVSAQYFYRTSDTSLKIAGDLSVSVWVNAESLGGDAYGRGIACYITANINAEGDWCIFLDDTGKITFEEMATGGTWDAHRGDTTALSTGTWYHIVARRSSGTETIRINNTNQSLTNSLGTAGWGTVEFRVGQQYESTSDGSWAFDGKIDMLAIWTRAISDAEVTTLYNSGAGLPYASWGGGAALTKNVADPLTLAEAVGSVLTPAGVGQPAIKRMAGVQHAQQVSRNYPTW
jgi:hypothetical protein